MEGFGSIVFPHCSCDSRKDGKVIPIVSFEGFKLQACKDDGTEEVWNIFLKSLTHKLICLLQNQVIEFLWSSIIQYDLDDEAMMFLFQYQRQNKPPRWVKIFSNHVRWLTATNCSFAFKSLFFCSTFSSTNALRESRKSNNGETKWATTAAITKTALINIIQEAFIDIKIATARLFCFPFQ